jgi:hypothetical protein
MTDPFARTPCGDPYSPSTRVRSGSAMAAGEVVRLTAGAAGVQMQLLHAHRSAHLKRGWRPRTDQRQPGFTEGSRRRLRSASVRLLAARCSRSVAFRRDTGNRAGAWLRRRCRRRSRRPAPRTAPRSAPGARAPSTRMQGRVQAREAEQPPARRSPSSTSTTPATRRGRCRSG